MELAPSFKIMEEEKKKAVKAAEVATGCTCIREDRGGGYRYEDIETGEDVDCEEYSRRYYKMLEDQKVARNLKLAHNANLSPTKQEAESIDDDDDDEEEEEEEEGATSPTIDVPESPEAAPSTADLPESPEAALSTADVPESPEAAPSIDDVPESPEAALSTVVESDQPSKTESEAPTPTPLSPTHDRASLIAAQEQKLWKNIDSAIEEYVRSVNSIKKQFPEVEEEKMEGLESAPDACAAIHLVKKLALS